MAFQPVAATCRGELNFTWDGQQVQNSLYFRRNTDYDVAGLTSVANYLSAWWVANLRPALANTLSLTNVTVTALHSQSGPQVISTAGLPSTGLVITGSVPNNVALCVSFRTALIGRAFRGRNYVPGIPEVNVTGSTMIPGDAEVLRFAYQQHIGEDAVDGIWVVVTRQVNGVIQLPSALTNPVTSVVLVDTVVDSQRRRLPGRGP